MTSNKNSSHAHTAPHIHQGHAGLTALSSSGKWPPAFGDQKIMPKSTGASQPSNACPPGSAAGSTVEDDFQILERGDSKTRLSVSSNDQQLDDKKTPQEWPKLQSKQLVMKGAMRGSRKNMQANLPPQLNATATVRDTRRFVAQTAGTTVYNITGNSFAGALGCVTYIANTTARAIAGTARIKQIRVWPSQDASAIANVADCRWAPGILSTAIRDTDYIENLPLGITVTRCVSFRPPKNSLAETWMNLGGISTAQICQLELSEGSVVDVSCEYTLSNNQTGPTITLSGVTAPVGLAGYTPLNGSGGGLLQVGVASLF